MQTTSYRQYYLPTKEIKNYNAMIDRQNFFDQPIRDNLTAYDNFPKKFNRSRRWLQNWLLARLWLILKIL